jgi:hypothetical protein
LSIAELCTGRIYCISPYTSFSSSTSFTFTTFSSLVNYSSNVTHNTPHDTMTNTHGTVTITPTTTQYPIKKSFKKVPSYSPDMSQ